MTQVDREREKLEEAKRSAEESVRLAEEAASVEKAERELKVRDHTLINIKAIGNVP